jgi:hypothetical protein
MPDDILAPEDEGFFAWLSRPRRAVLNTLRGEYGMATDQALDFVLNIPDALLPGDVIPEQSGPDSDIEVGDLADMEPGWKKTAVDIAGGIALDPMTYVPIAGTVAKVAGAARQAAKAVPALDKGLTKGRNLVADTMNWHTLTPQQRAMEQSAKSAGTMAERASEVRGKQIIDSLELPEREAVAESIRGVYLDPATGQAATLGSRVSGVAQPLTENYLDAVKSMRQHPVYLAASPDRKAAIRQALKDSVSLGQTQADEFLLPRTRPNPAGVLNPGEAVGPYLHNPMNFEDAATAALSTSAKPTGASSAILAKKLDTPEALRDWLNGWDDAAKVVDPDLAKLRQKAYQRDLAPALLLRAQQQGKIATRATIGESVLGRRINLTDKTDRTEVIKKLDDMIAANGPERDFAVRAKTLFTGDLKMDSVSEAMAWFNRTLFKKAATVGVVVPRFSFSVRNSLSALMQALSTPGARGAALSDKKWMLDRIHDGISAPLDEAVKIFTKGKVHKISDDVNKTLAIMDDAFAASKGSVEGTKNFLRASTDPRAKEALEVLEQNVIDNPIRLDDMMAEVHPDAPVWKNIAKDIWELPANMNRHLENRMRTGLFLAAKKAGQKSPAAAASVRNSLLDYSVPTIENRRMRTWIPFGAFISQSMPQTGKLLTENLAEGGIPGALAGGTARGAANQMFESDPDSPVYPDMLGKMAIPLDERDAEGNPQYLTSLGLPIEGLGEIPQSFSQRELERFVGSAANPLIKAAYSRVSGRDPFFGTAVTGYDKPYAAMEALGMERGPAANAIRQVAGSGIAQPVVHALNTVEPWLDDRQGVGLDLMRATTGARVRSVDEDQAVRLALEEALRQNPGIRQYSTFSKGTDDPETVDLIAEYNEVRKRIRDKRKAAKEEAANVQ